jgi:hypothetical protein
MSLFIQTTKYFDCESVLKRDGGELERTITMSSDLRLTWTSLRNRREYAWRHMALGEEKR